MKEEYIEENYLSPYGIPCRSPLERSKLIRKVEDPGCFRDLLIQISPDYFDDIRRKLLIEPVIFIKCTIVLN